MPDITNPDNTKSSDNGVGRKQLLWFAGLYVVGLIVTALVVYGLRWVVGD